jgi:hypothetical protein
MTMGGSDITYPVALAPNALCRSYVEAALRWAETYLLPISNLVECGKLGDFNFSRVAGARELHDEMKASDIAYYRLWKEAEGLQLTTEVEPAASVDDGSDEE